ncbi:hypothetical protein SLS60_011315 [Paraconiothyrium brasiliense]|uniref:Transposase n=1 Tax=Paraconiothyrium brasiliense TaxID=300254 RepID=A0ABR3QJB4_9PLEO
MDLPKNNKYKSGYFKLMNLELPMKMLLHCIFNFRNFEIEVMHNVQVHAKPLVGLFLNIPRVELVKEVRDAWRELRKYDDTLLRKLLDLLVVLYRDKAIAPFAGLAEWLNKWARWLAETPNKPNSRPAVNGKGGIMVLSGVEGRGRHKDTEAMKAHKAAFRWSSRTTEQKGSWRAKVADMEKSVETEWENWFQRDFKAVEEMLGLGEKYGHSPPPRGFRSEEVGETVFQDDTMAREEGPGKEKQYGQSRDWPASEVIDLGPPSDGSEEDEVQTKGEDGPENIDQVHRIGTLPSSLVTEEAVQSLSQEERFRDSSRFTNSHKNSGRCRTGVQDWLDELP